VGIWPLQDVVITNSVLCIAYNLEFGGGGVYRPISVQCNGVAPGWAMRVGGGNERMVSSFTTASQ